MSAPRGWDPIVKMGVNPEIPDAKMMAQFGGRKHHYQYREHQRAVDLFGFRNRQYNGTALVFEDGSMHLSFKRNDRAAVRDWRHFQAIKNEVAGIDREAVEVFPPESMLVDAANEYHLFVLPPGTLFPMGMAASGVVDAGEKIPGVEVPQMDHALYRLTKGAQGVGAQQRPWEDGIPTGVALREQIVGAAGGLIRSALEQRIEELHDMCCDHDANDPDVLARRIIRWVAGLDDEDGRDE